MTSREAVKRDEINCTVTPVRSAFHMSHSGSVSLEGCTASSSFPDRTPEPSDVTGTRRETLGKIKREIRARLFFKRMKLSRL